MTAMNDAAMILEGFLYGVPSEAWLPKAVPILNFGGGISVNIDTGEVSVPEGMTLSDAAKAFWNAVATIRGADRPFPEMP